MVAGISGRLSAGSLKRLFQIGKPCFYCPAHALFGRMIGGMGRCFLAGALGDGRLLCKCFLQSIKLPTLLLILPKGGANGGRRSEDCRPNLVKAHVIGAVLALGYPAFQNIKHVLGPVEQAALLIGLFAAGIEMPQIPTQEFTKLRGHHARLTRPFQLQTRANMRDQINRVRHQSVIRREHSGQPTRRALGFQHVTQPQMHSVIGFISRNPVHRGGHFPRMTMGAHMQHAASGLRKDAVPKRQQATDARVLDHEQMRAAIIGVQGFQRAGFEFRGLGRGEPIGSNRIVAEPFSVSRGEQFLVQPSDPVGFEKSLGVQLVRRHQILRQIRAHLGNHPRQGRGARTVHAKNDQGRAGRLGGGFLLGHGPGSGQGPSGLGERVGACALMHLAGQP